MNVELRIDKRKIENFKDFRDVLITVERNLDTYNVSARLENIEIYDQDFDYLLQIYTTDTYRKMEAELKVGQLVLRGVVDVDSIKVGDRRMVLSLLLDEKSIFERDVAGQLVRKTTDVFCILERKTDVVLAATLLIAAVFYLELAIRQIKEVKSELAESVALIASGAPAGAAAATILKAAKIVLRVAYLAIIIVAFVQVFRRLLELIPKPVKQPAINIVDAIQRAISEKGYVLSVPTEYRNLWIVGKEAEYFEVIELIKTLQDITNSRIVITNKTIRFLPRTVVSFPFSNRAFTEFWRYNTDEIVGRQVISLATDLADFRASEEPFLVEIIYEKLRGYKKVALPFAPAKIKSEETFFDRILKDAYEFYRRAASITRSKLAEAPILSNAIILASDFFVPKLLYTKNLVNISPLQNRQLLEFIADAYSQQNIQAKVFTAKMHLSLSEFSFLYENGWPGVRRLSYNPHTEVAEIEYEISATFSVLTKQVIFR